MSNQYFQFKQFTIKQDKCAMKVSTEACILGAWFARQKIQSNRVLDIGSGTGLLMIMLAQKWTGIMHGIEINPGTARQLQQNIYSSPWKENCMAFEGDIRSYSFPIAYDFIITNPPFYEQQLKSSDPSINLARHSSGLSLEELLNAIDRNLSTEGSFGIILPTDRAGYFEKMAGEKGFFLIQKLDIQHSSAHIPFRRILHMGRKVIDLPGTATLMIRDIPGNYSGDFIQLMKDYYLYL
jgi:tRNA1Val (adenine37-N6)-methyltransferase